MWINVYSIHREALTDQSTDTTKTQLGESASVQELLTVLKVSGNLQECG